MVPKMFELLKFDCDENSFAYLAPDKTGIKINISSFLHKNICYVYSLEASRKVLLMGTHSGTCEVLLMNIHNMCVME